MRSGRDFTAAVRKGSRAGRHTVVVHLSRADAPDPTGAPSPSPARVGLVVSKAVGSAVVRNRVKRRLRHLAAGRLAELPPGALLVVRANPAAATAATLGADFDAALHTVLRRDRGAR